MELLCKLLEQIAFITRPKIKEHLLIVMDKSTHEDHLSQPLQTNNKLFKIAVTFLSGYNGILNITNSNKKFYFKKSIPDENFFQNIIRPGAYEIESSNNETKRIIIDKSYYSDKDYPFKIKPSFCTLGSFVEISPPGPITGFVLNDGIGNLLGFNETKLWQEYKILPNPVVILSLDNIFIECKIAKGIIFRGKRSGITHIFTMTVSPGYKYVEKIRGGIQWYMMKTNDFISSINFKLKKEIIELKSFNGQSITFR